jgi:[ribosomal protein S5]-alanine N-acetyltransferase
MKLETAHLRLLPCSPESLLALIEGEATFERSFGLPPAVGLREFMVSGDISPAWLARLRASKETDPWIHGFAVATKETPSVIGMAGFKGPPDSDGVVEIAYGIVPTYEGRGYATEAAASLVGFARDSGLVRVVRAHTLPTPNASTRVLTKCAFVHIGEIVDPEDGLVWRWGRSVGPTSPTSSE